MTDKFEFSEVDETSACVGNSMDKPGSAHGQVRYKHTNVVVDRPVYTQTLFDEGHDHVPRHRKTVRDHIHKKVTQDCEVSPTCVKDSILARLPFFRIMKKYNVKEMLLADIISGLTVGIMHIPQGMGYSLLAALAPIYGLYVSFFPALFYTFLGSSNHISMGTIAVTSLMIGSVVEKHIVKFVPLPNTIIPANSSAAFLANSTVAPYLTNTDNSSLLSASPLGADGDIPDFATQELAYRVKIATAVTLCAGVVQLLMGVCRLGFVTIYLSDPLISGFTTGAACYVFTSQVKYVLCLKIKRFVGPFNLIRTYIEIFKNIASSNIASCIITAICIVILVLTKEFLNPRVKKKIKAPLPIELFLLVIVTTASFFGKFHENYGVKVVGKIPTGLPSIEPPPTELITATMGDAVALAIVSFAISVSLAKIFARKHCYEVDANQELIAYGSCSLIGSFLSCYVPAASLSRSSVQESVGGKTQLAGFIAIWLVLLVILFIGPLFEQLPNCVLSAIIWVALKGLFLQFRELKRLWFICKIDFCVWLVTFLATVVLDVDLGLLLGVGFSFFTIVIRTQRARSAILGRVPHTDIYTDVKAYKSAQQIEGIKIFRFEASLCYANREHFKESLYTMTEVNPNAIKIQRNKYKRKIDAERKMKVKQEKKSTVTQLSDSAVKTLVNEEYPDLPSSSIHHVILDLSTMGYIDSVAVNTIATIMEEYKEVDVSVFLANCKGPIWEMLESAGFFEKIAKETLFLTVHDAVLTALDKHHQMLDLPSNCATPLAARVQREICDGENSDLDKDTHSNGQITKAEVLHPRA